MAQSLSSAPSDNETLRNSGARADTIRQAVQYIAEREAEVASINAAIREYKSRTIKGDLGFKLADWNAIFRVSQLSAEDRDELLETIREGFQALGISSALVDDVVDAAGAMPAAPTRPDPKARALGRQDGLAGTIDHQAQYPSGAPGHADYMLGRDDGEAERARVMAMGNGTDAGAAIHQMHGGEEAAATDTSAPSRRRGRPRGSRNRPKSSELPDLDPAA